MNIRKLFALVLTLCLLLAAVPLYAQADYQAMTSSDELIGFIKKCEGFTATKQWDYGHYSIGYGCSCGADEYPNGITEAQAEALLRRCLSQSEDVVNRFCRSHDMHPTQSQFDCMVDLSYALGASWMDSGYTLPKLMIKGCTGGGLTELELLDTMGDWINVGGEPWEGTMHRRMRETYMFFHAEYDQNGYINIAQDVPYASLWLDANGGQSAYRRVYTFRGQPYSAYKPLPTPTRSGYRFVGWFDANGNQITNNTVAASVLVRATARWEETVVAPPPADLFTDVWKTDWFFADVKTATDNGIFAGYNDGSFRPNAEMTRAMFAQVLYRISDAPAVDTDVPFADVAPDSWYYDAVCWAYDYGIVRGVSETEFRPDAPITREQMATMLFNYSARHGAADSSLFGSLEDFNDGDEVSQYALDPMKWAVGTELIRGVGNNQLSPKTVTTRAQAATILVRLSRLVLNGVA